MTKSDMDVVSAFRTVLASRIGQDRLDLWFGDKVRLQTSGQAVKVIASDQFSLDRIRKNFRDDLLQVAREVLGCEPKIDFRVDSASSQTDSQTTLPFVAKTSPSEAQSPAENVARTNTITRTRPLFRWSDFVVGDCNRLAYTGAETMMNRLGQVSPLFIHGPTGCGKTHLLSAIASEIRRRNAKTQSQSGVSKTLRIVNLTAEQFTSHFLEALQGSGLPSFRRKYRDVDVLLIDDVQFFHGKRATLVELQHTIDSLLRDGKQIILTADRPPIELNGLNAELIARMTGGLVCSLEPADEPTRLQIAQRMASQRGMMISDDVLQMIASHINGDVRLLSGALNRLQATSQATGQTISVDMAETALSDLFRTTRRAVRLSDIENAVCDVFGVDTESLQSGRKSKAVSQPRMLAMWLARKYTRAAFAEIGEHFGRRSHSTVISAQKKVDSWVKSGEVVQMAHGQCQVQDALRRVEAQLRTG